MSGGSILLVEDNPDDEALAMRALRRHHLLNEVVVARDGEEAVNHLLNVAELPMLVLLDLKLPKIDGMGVLRRIREDPRTRSLPVVVLVSSKEESAQIDGQHLGTNGYMRKPVDFPQLLEAVRSLGLSWVLAPAPAPQPHPT